MPDHNIVTRLLETPGFGWQCGEPLRDKGSYFRCSCGCSQPDADSDGYLTISQPEILREAADEIKRLRKERDEARRDLCMLIVRGNAGYGFKGGMRDVAKEKGWDCFEKDGNA
jgi:hypothetical protein